MAISSLLIFIHKRNAKSRVYTKFLWFLQWETAQHHRLQWGKFQFCGLHCSSSFTNIKTFQSPCRRASSEVLMDSRKFWVITNSVSVTYPTLNLIIHHQLFFIWRFTLLIQNGGYGQPTLINLGAISCGFVLLPEVIRKWLKSCFGCCTMQYKPSRDCGLRVWNKTRIFFNTTCKRNNSKPSI